jgi:aminoglycoside-2''-adenylyltransferase
VPGLAELVSVLVHHDVRFIIVGGMAGALQGAPVNTLDLDIVYSRDGENVRRLLTALKSVSARFRDDPRHVEPNESHLLSKGHKLLATSHGQLDVLGTIEEDSGYEELIDSSDQLELAGHTVHVLSLERLIRVKEKLARPKDQLMLLILRATLDERRKMQSPAMDEPRD